MIELLIIKFWPYLVGLAGLIGSGVLLYFKGKSKATKEAEERQAKEKQETKERMDEVVLPVDPDGVDKWLHDRSKSKRDM